MVADMNVSGITQAQTIPTDSPKQQTDADTTTLSFSEALTHKEQKKPVKTDAPQKQDSKVTKDSKNVTKESEPNPLTTKPNKKQDQATLAKALKESKKENNNEVNGEELNETELEKKNVKDSEAEKTKKVDSNSKDSQLIKNNNPTKIEEENKEDGASRADLSADSAQSSDENIDETQIKKGKVKSTESKAKDTAQKQEVQLKSLNDVKKEAQARNLNLQKMEIIENGRKNPINPQDLMDRSLLEDNKERLALSLQDKGQALSTSLAKTNMQDIGEQAKKDALLAELLNRYDANANAKRKMQNEIEKIQFKIGDGDKSMVIERTRIQPKNITDSKVRNEIMEQEFLEELQGITGDEDLADLLEVNRAKITAHIAQQNSKVANGKDSIMMQKTYQGWAQQGQFLDPKEIKDSKNVAFEMDVQKPFDAVFAENLKTDSKTKETDAITKTDKKSEEASKEKIDAKQEVGSIHTKQEVSVKNAMARETMRHFASQFKEEILNYKPPITRINLELNPANLGQVAMTISKKGKDLQVSITSNANVMTMFVQNAQELRQNLMQIGFNNLDLNFSTHDGQGSNTEQNDSRDQNERGIKLQSIEEAEAQTQLGNVPQTLEVTLPQYA
ncbi:flagellar hook-length control protein FliK [Helicobacter trogontum]|uniref:Flagellar hook-length control protein-like C-terminal domain-containing protein n=1 Tax=Helicobacter trogontum TaxID=50960 RepID=A0A4U8S5N7_9HELI|nr:flagellar hook-length control protein FliK [Helicobacter trogontum]TLD81125.1 hypothetical protein LS81_009140 [Helicobacter trogontum]